MKRLLNFYKRLALIVSALLFVFAVLVPALPAHAEGDATDDTKVQTDAPKAAEEPASPPPNEPAPNPDPPVKEVVTDGSEADAAAAKLAADEAAAEAAKAKAKAEAEAAKVAADKAAADAAAAKVATDTEEVVDPEPPAEPATTSSATACVLSDALIRVTVTTGDGKPYYADVDIESEQVTPDAGGTVPDTFDIDNDGQQSVKVKVMSDGAPFDGTVNVASSCSGGSGDNGGGDPGDGGGGDPEPEPVGPLPSKVNDINMSTTVNEQIVLLDDASWAHIDDEFKCTPNNGQVFDAWGVNPEVYYLPNEGFTGVDEFTCTVTRGDKSLTFQVKVTVTEPDADGDGTPDKDDAFPQDPKESKDSDEDGVGNKADECESTPVGEAVDANGCSASQRDTDHDGLTDAQEAELGTDPAKADTDGDGYSDRTEVEEGTNPLDPGSYPDVVVPPKDDIKVSLKAGCGFVKISVPRSGTETTVLYGEFGNREPDGTVVIMPGKSKVIETTRKQLDMVIFGGEGSEKIVENFEVAQQCKTDEVDDVEPGDSVDDTNKSEAPVRGGDESRGKDADTGAEDGFPLGEIGLVAGAALTLAGVAWRRRRS